MQEQSTTGAVDAAMPDSGPDSMTDVKPVSEPDSGPVSEPGVIETKHDATIIEPLSDDIKPGTVVISNRGSSTTDLIAAVFFTAISIAALLIVRVALFYYESFDYIHTLSQWILQYQNMSFFEGLGTKVGNYNQPYMYILNILARIPVSDLYTIKIVSVIFDFVLAYFVMQLISLRYNSMNIRILSFLLAFAVPTVIMNSAMWAQCDSIYVSFVIAAIYYALSGSGGNGNEDCADERAEDRAEDRADIRRSRKTFALIAIAVSFKLQAAFVFPLFAVFVMQKKIRLKDIWVFVTVYLALLLPAFAAGFPADDLLLMYLHQSNTYHYLSLNAVNVWQFFENVEFEPFRTVGLYAGGTAVLGLMYFAYVHRQRISSDVDYIRLAFLFAVFVPFLLPQMHDRFYYMADILALVLFMYDKRRWFVPLVCVFCSFLSYAWLVMGYVHIFDYRIAALGLTAVIFIVLRDLVLSLRRV